MTRIYMATASAIVDVQINGSVEAEACLTGGPFTDIVADPQSPECLYATTQGSGLWSTCDGGASWGHATAGLHHARLSAAVVSGPDRKDGLGALYVGTEPSALYRSDDGGRTFTELPGLQEIPSRTDWSFPPRPDTHHVWSLAADPHEPGRLYVGIELGGVMCTEDGGATFIDSSPDADGDPHTLRTHPGAPGRVYESGGSFFCESRDGGRTWQRDLEGIPEEIRYFYSLAVDPGDPDTIIISAARDPFTGHAREEAKAWSTLYRRTADRPWHELTAGLPERQGTRMGWLSTDGQTAGAFFYVTIPGELYRSGDAGDTWEQLPFAWPEGVEPAVRRTTTTVR